MERLKNFGDRANTNGLDKNPQNINSDGRPLSIKSDLKKILGANGEMTIKAESVKQIHKDGSVTIHLAQSETLALRLLDWAMSRKGSDALKAIKMITETIEGKPNQKTKVEVSIPVITGMTIE